MDAINKKLQEPRKPWLKVYGSELANEAETMVQLARWWLQFPRTLRRVAQIRGVAALGAGGILFLGPLVFNRLGLSSSQIGLALALSSAVGLVARASSGLLLDRGTALGTPLRLGAICSIGADVLLFRAHSFNAFVTGELLLGLAMGLYWPAAELASAQFSAPLPSSEGFALARTADALGIAAGALIGSCIAWGLGAQALRLIYGVDLVGMLVLLWLIRGLPKRGLPPAPAKLAPGQKRSWWGQSLLPLLAVSLLGTGLLTLQQSALPLDLANGGLARPGLPEAGGGLLIVLQLLLVLMLQWPVGHWLGSKPVAKGLRLSLLCFSGGCILLAFSALHPKGLLLLLLAQPLLALGTAAFLPTITEAVVESVSSKNQGLALGIYSQTWAISGISLPPLAGLLMEFQGHGLGLWLVMAGLCLAALGLLQPSWGNGSVPYSQSS